MSIHSLKGTANCLVGFADATGVREDWHEPDEKDVTATTIGNTLDNAFGDDPHNMANERIVLLRVRQGDPLPLNLASLLALATYGARRLLEGE